MNGLTVSLAQEVAPLGIKVTLIVPGSFRTEFVSNPPSRNIADYETTVHAFADRVAAGAGKQPGDPKRAALAGIEAVEAEYPPLYLVLGTDALHRTPENQATLAPDLTA